MRRQRTGCALPEQLLHVRGKADDVIRRSRPEDEAVARVLESRLDGPVLKPEQERVDDELLEVGTEELCLLLRIAVRPVHRVERLDFLLPSALARPWRAPCRWCGVRPYRIVVAGPDQRVVGVLSRLDYNT